MCLGQLMASVDTGGMKRTAALGAIGVESETRSNQEITVDIRSDRSGRSRCAHQNQRSTTHAGLRRVFCEMCKRVNVDFVDSADTGVLFRVSRLG